MRYCCLLLSYASKGGLACAQEHMQHELGGQGTDVEDLSKQWTNRVGSLQDGWRWERWQRGRDVEESKLCHSAIEEAASNARTDQSQVRRQDCVSQSLGSTAIGKPHAFLFLDAERVWVLNLTNYWKQVLLKTCWRCITDVRRRWLFTDHNDKGKFTCLTSWSRSSYPAQFHLRHQITDTRPTGTQRRVRDGTRKAHVSWLFRIRYQHDFLNTANLELQCMLQATMNLNAEIGLGRLDRQSIYMDMVITYQ